MELRRPGRQEMMVTRTKAIAVVVMRSVQYLDILCIKANICLADGEYVKERNQG